MSSAYSRPIQAMIDALSRLPSVGPKSAQRIAFHLLKSDRDEVEKLTHAIATARATVQFCEHCFNFSESTLCHICNDDRRDGHTLCVVEESRDVVAIEKTGQYRGRYHVLLGAMNPLEGIGPEQLKMRELLLRLDPEDITEVILCLNPNTEGEVTNLYLARLLKPLGIRVTQLAMGLPVGGDLEYADEV
ncbi:MAG: recombination protein RecR, partial [Actinobacteria bacterium]|nr:recombination protein RecR [Actinomycetota bacterium]